MIGPGCPVPNSKEGIKQGLAASIEHLTKALLHRCSNERADELTNTHIPDLCLDD